MVRNIRDMSISVENRKTILQGLVGIHKGGLFISKNYDEYPLTVAIVKRTFHRVYQTVI